MTTKKERLDKILSCNGFGSRKDVKKLLHSGAVYLNGIICRDPTTHADALADVIMIGSHPLKLKQTAWIMLNKPAGVLSASKDPQGNTTVIDILSAELTAGYREGELFPVGRLDIDTEGLLLITNDGDAAHRLTSPKSCIDKMYYVRLELPLTAQEQAEYERRFAEGIHITADRGEKAHDCLGARIEFVRNSEEKTGKAAQQTACEALLTIREGKYHQVKRMFFALGNRVAYLKRMATGKLRLDESLAAGQARKLTAEEIQLLFTSPV